MPSNQCTNSLTELSFAVGNMIGAQQCDVDDWRQIRDQLASWECSDRGKAGDALAQMFGTVTSALKRCATDDGCQATDCKDLFENHEELAQALNVYDPLHIGRGYRGALPPKIHGIEGIARTGTLAAQREAEIARVQARKDAEEARKKIESVRRTPPVSTPAGTPAGTPAARYSSEESSEERRERWYPARA